MRKMILMLGAAALLAGCSSNNKDCAQSSNPAECQMWVDGGGDLEDYLIGGMAGYMVASMMQGGKKVTYITVNPNYHGPKRTLRSPILARDQQIRRMETRLRQQEAKIARQKTELRNQQEANRRKNEQMRSSSSTRSSSSSRTSFRSGRR